MAGGEIVIGAASECLELLVEVWEVDGCGEPLPAVQYLLCNKLYNTIFGIGYRTLQYEYNTICIM